MVERNYTLRKRKKLLPDKIVITGRERNQQVEKEKTRFFFIIVKTFSFLRTRWHCNYASRRRNNNKKEIVYISLKYFWDYRIPQLAFYKITAGNNPWFFPSICSRLWCIALEASTSQLVGWKTSFGSSIASYIYIYIYTPWIIQWCTVIIRADCI